MTFERGVPINSPVMLSLPQERRNQLGEASLEIAVREILNGAKCKLTLTLVTTLFV